MASLNTPPGFARGGRIRQALAPLEWAGNRATAPFRLLPEFLIIGAQKSGTTSLCSHLFAHPQVLPSRRKEVHFFDAPEYAHGRGWYQAHFVARRTARSKSQVLGHHVITGEASPYYLAYPHAPRRVHELLPDAKLIVMLRNPIDRALSHYHHQVRMHREPLSFEEAIEAEPPRLCGEKDRMLADDTYYSHAYWAYSYLTRGHYADQLNDWFEYFPRSQILVIGSEKFFAEPAVEFQRTLDFLSLDPVELDAYAKQNTGSYSRMEAAVRAKLERYFQPHNERLYEILGYDFGW